ncbi:MAG: hypothetical protein L0Y71_03145 [Gemmataceae bacterium]|nr:hypothetical protein [Gemmataceae bacterium]
MSNRRFLGVTVLPEYIQNERIDGVLENLARMGVTAVATSPYVMAPADEKTGGREPPLDAGAGKVRLLDRPLWGKRELFVRTAPSFTPEERLYEGLVYRPAAATELTRKQGPLIRDFLRAAQSRHLKVYLQVQAAIPPGYRVQFGGPREDDRPRLPDGRRTPRVLANNGSLASPHVRDYGAALIRDLLRAYPDIDGLRFDWPEYPPYLLDDVFLDFGEPARAAARRLGFDFERMRQAAATLYKTLHGGLHDRHLTPLTDADGGRFVLTRRLADNPGLTEWLRFKATLVDELLAGYRRVMNESGGKGKEMMPNAFPPPFTLASGFDFARVARHSSAISVKLYAMHWAMMLRFYGDALMKANPRLSERVLVRALVRLFDIADDEGLPRLADYHYPEPEEAHPVGAGAQARKIAQAQSEAGTIPILTLAHGYGPAADFRRRLHSAWHAGGRHGIWINRYGYLSDEKMKIVGEVCR